MDRSRIHGTVHPPEHLRRPAIAADILRAIAALFFACMACGPALAAQFDPSIPEPRLLPADSDKAAAPVPVWHSRYAVEDPGKGDSPIFADTKIGTVPRQAPPPQHRRPQPRRSSTVSGIKQTNYQRDYQPSYRPGYRAGFVPNGTTDGASAERPDFLRRGGLG